MEKVVSFIQIVDTRRKQTDVHVAIRREVKECMHAVLRTITEAMFPSTYLRGITKLLSNADDNVKRKVCNLLSSSLLLFIVELVKMLRSIPS